MVWQERARCLGNSAGNPPAGRADYARAVEPTPQLTHVDDRGAARMVDVSAKDVTVRTAAAAGPVRHHRRGDRAAAPRRAAQGRRAGRRPHRRASPAAKRTPDLIPLCHPVALHGVTVDLDVGDDGVVIDATTRTADRTGVEMEALTAVVAAGLALYDMVKAVDRSAQLTDVRLLHKAGGRSGEWTRGVKAAVITCSNRSAAGERADDPGELLAELLPAPGTRSSRASVVPDEVDAIRARGARRAGRRCAVVLTTGGTGLTPTDVTPEAVAPLLEREVPGIAEALRRCRATRCRPRCCRAAWPGRSATRWS